MPEWVVMTVGLNPLPCLVEAYRICALVRERTGQLPQFLVFTGGRDYEADQIHKGLLNKLSEAGGKLSLKWYAESLPDPFDPGSICRTAKDKLPEFLSTTDTIHYPYTGGTKAMSLHVYEALREFGAKKVISSYLNPAEHKLLSSSPDECSPGDERTAWRLSTYDLAQLHSFRMNHPKPVDPAVEAFAVSMLAALIGGEHEGFTRWLGKEWKRAFGGSSEKDVWIDRFNRWPHPPVSVPWYEGNSSNWATLSDRLAAIPAFGKEKVFSRTSGGTWHIQICEPVKHFIIPLYHFLDNQSLEIYAYSTIRKLLPPDCEVLHSVHFAEVGSGNDCELDVVAILGYQLVAISCTLSSNYGQCKKKGFEIIHRARQIGGDHARAAVLCLLNDHKRNDLESELKKDMGLSNDKHFRVFGITSLADVGGQDRKLATTLKNYLGELKWLDVLPVRQAPPVVR